MSRVYEFEYRKGNETVVVRGVGNVINSAERSSRHRLRDKVGDLDGWYWVGRPRYIKPEDR